MVIAYFSHAEDIPFNIGESDKFMKLITLPITVGPDYCSRNRNMIGSELLDCYWKSYQTKTIKDLLDEADVFGLVFLGDLATIKGRTLIKIIASLFNVPVAVLGVKDCSIHLAQGGNKDATFISEAFKPDLGQYNEKKSCANLVFFDSESNIQKAGKIIAASYCSKKLNLWSYVETLWSKTGKFGLVGNNHNLFIILLYLIKGYIFIGLKHWIWEDPTGTMVSLGRFSYP